MVKFPYAILKIILIVLTGLFVTTCGKKDDGKTLVVWDWKSGDPILSAYFKGAREAFKARYPDLKIRFVSQPHDQYYTLLGTALSAGRGPDVVMVHGGARTRQRTNALLPLNTAVVDLKNDLKGWEAFQGEDGNIYAAPLSLQGLVIYFNREIYLEAGLNPDQPPVTWQALSEACDKITKNTKSACFSMGNKEGLSADFFFSSVAANTLTADQQKAWKKGELTWSDPVIRKIVTAWQKTWKQGWYRKGANSTPKFMDEYEGFMRGEVANTIGLLSDVANWKQFENVFNPNTLGVVIMAGLQDQPNGLNKLPSAGGIGYGVIATTQKKDAAIDFVRMMTNPEHAAEFLDAAGTIPSNIHVDTSIMKSKLAGQLLKWLGGKQAPMAHEAMPAAEAESWHRQSQLLLNGTITVDQAISRLDDVRKAEMK